MCDTFCLNPVQMVKIAKRQHQDDFIFHDFEHKEFVVFRNMLTVVHCMLLNDARTRFLKKKFEHVEIRYIFGKKR